MELLGVFLARYSNPGEAFIVGLIFAVIGAIYYTIKDRKDNE